MTARSGTAGAPGRCSARRSTTAPTSTASRSARAASSPRSPARRRAASRSTARGGRDRTGMIAMLLLSLVGVAPDGHRRRLRARAGSAAAGALDGARHRRREPRHRRVPARGGHDRRGGAARVPGRARPRGAAARGGAGRRRPRRPAHADPRLGAHACLTASAWPRRPPTSSTHTARSAAARCSSRSPRWRGRPRACCSAACRWTRRRRSPLRAFFAGLALGLWVAISERGRVVQACRSVGLAGIGFAVAIASASASFIVALNHTTVAHVLFIQAMAPVLAALLAWVALGEPISGRTAVAMAVALAGVGVMIGGPGEGGGVGDLLSLLMAFSFAVSIVISRHRRDVSMLPRDLPGADPPRPRVPAVRRAGLDPGRRPARARRARRGPDRARPRLPDRRRAADPGGAGRAHHAARGRPRTDLGVAGRRRAAEHRDARSAARS